MNRLWIMNPFRCMRNARTIGGSVTQAFVTHFLFLKSKSTRKMNYGGRRWGSFPNKLGYKCWWCFTRYVTLWQTDRKYRGFMHRQRLSRKESYWLTMVRLVAYVTCSRSSIFQRYVSSLLYRNVCVNEVCFVSTVEVCCFVVVAVLWGATNPFLKKGTEGIERVKKGNIILQFLAEVKFLFLNFKVKSCSPRIQLLCTDIWRRICESCWIKKQRNTTKM